jgi:BirA family biotin operon repressor/biotin-[acetyl-CoA-carboxylase] ligase
MASSRARIVELLRGSDGYVSGRDVAEALGISRNAIWKHVEALRRAGYEIESVRSRGYRLLAAPDVVSAEELGPRLQTRWLGRTVVHHATTGSTNSDAAALGRAGAEDGTVVIADSQSAGRGRLGRSWASVSGVNLYLSALLRPPIVPAAAPQLSLLAGVAVAASLEAEGLAPLIKWPNDVLLDGRKVCGILTEIEAEADRVSFVVVGVGVNLNSSLEHFPAELHETATSVLLSAGRRVDRVGFTARLLTELETLYERFSGEGFPAIAPLWESRAALRGRRVTVSGAGEVITGTCVGIDSDGALLLKEEDDARPRRILAGDVTVIGGYGR